MINLLQHSLFSTIGQNGFLSERAPLLRGCRRGDPISPCIFDVCAEVLSHALRECEEVRDIQVHDTEMLVSQYAADTTLFPVKDLNSLNFAVHILKWFEKEL